MDSSKTCVRKFLFCDPLILTRSLTATSQSSTIFPALELKWENKTNEPVRPPRTLLRAVRIQPPDFTSCRHASSKNPEAADSQTNVIVLPNASTSAPDVVTTSVNPPPAAEASSVAPDLDPIKIPLPMKKVRRTSRQVQVDRQNQRKQKEINSQAHMRA